MSTESKINLSSNVEDMISDLLTDHVEDEVVVANSIVESADVSAAKTNGDSLMSAIELSGECTIYEIAQLHQQILEKWKENSELIVDTSAVTEVDASFIQLLASCKKSAAEKNGRFQLLNPSEEVNNKIQAMFMQNFFSEVEQNES